MGKSPDFEVNYGKAKAEALAATAAAPPFGTTTHRVARI